MRTFYFMLVSLFTVSFGFAQAERTLDETKAYIVKIINENGWKENSRKNRLNAEFEGDLLKIKSSSTLLGQVIDEDEAVYNFANVYRYKGPIKQPGDIAYVVIWVDYLSNKKTGKWTKRDLEMDIGNFEAGEQLMIAFRHLNKLLREKKPAVEKF